MRSEWTRVDLIWPHSAHRSRGGGGLQSDFSSLKADVVTDPKSVWSVVGLNYWPATCWPLVGSKVTSGRCNALPVMESTLNGQNCGILFSSTSLAKSFYSEFKKFSKMIIAAVLKYHIYLRSVYYLDLRHSLARISSSCSSCSWCLIEAKPSSEKQQNSRITFHSF